MNILNGGKHAILSSDFQEYMIIPLGFENYSDAINCCVKIYWTIKSYLESKFCKIILFGHWKRYLLVLFLMNFDKNWSESKLG